MAGSWVPDTCMGKALCSCKLGEQRKKVLISNSGYREPEAGGTLLPLRETGWAPPRKRSFDLGKDITKHASINNATMPCAPTADQAVSFPLLGEADRLVGLVDCELVWGFGWALPLSRYLSFSLLFPWVKNHRNHSGFLPVLFRGGA